MAYSTEEFENKCMDIIEKIVSMNIKYKRQDAIKIAEKMLEAAKAKTAKTDVISVYERVVKEFNIATDAEYEMLRKQIFDEDK